MPPKPINTKYRAAATSLLTGRCHDCDALPTSVKAGMATVAAAITMMSVSIVPSCIPRRAFDQPGGDRNRQDRPALRIYAGREMNATSLALFLDRRTASLAALLILPHHCGKTGSRGPKMSLARVRRARLRSGTRRTCLARRGAPSEADRNHLGHPTRAARCG